MVTISLCNNCVIIKWDKAKEEEENAIHFVIKMEINTNYVDGKQG